MEIIPQVADIFVSALMIGSLVLTAMLFAVMASQIMTEILG